MDRLIQKSERRGEYNVLLDVLWSVSIIDYLGIFALLVFYAVKSSGPGISLVDTIYTSVLMLHFLSFGFTFAVSRTGIDINFTLAAVAATVLVFFVDVIVLVLRFLDTDSSTETMVINILHTAWALVTLGEFIILSVFLKVLVKQRRKINFNLMETKVSNLQIDNEFRVKKSVARARTWLKALFLLELALVFFFLLAFVPGFVTGARYAWVTLTILPHFFQWIWVIAIAGSDWKSAVTVPGNSLLAFLQVLVAGSTGLDSLALVFRFVLLIQSAYSVSFVFSIVSFAITLLFVMVGILYNINLERLYRGLEKQEKDKKE